MPELPEVQTIVSDLNQHITGFQIVKILIEKGYIVYPSKHLFGKIALNQEITSVQRVAKNILIKLKNSYFIHFHLAMTGRILLREPDQKSDNWVKLILNLKRACLPEGTGLTLKFADMRMFGKAELLSSQEVEQLKNKYGPEPLDENLTPEVFLQKIKSKNSTIKNVLLDQQIISGLGNIYATDALFLANIHPESLTKDITLNQAKNLLLSAKQVLQEGIKNRGSTLPDKMYVDIFGNPGFYQNFFKIYSKQTCPKCKTKVEFKKVAGRGTYFCPRCQEL